MWKEKYCKACGGPALGHVSTWLEEFSNQAQRLIFRHLSPRWLDSAIDISFEKLFTAFKLGSFRCNFIKGDVDLRTWCLAEELKRRDLQLELWHGPFGPTTHSRLSINGKTVRFNGLPGADFVSKLDTVMLDDKEATRQRLVRARLPVPEGRAFWVWQKRQALRYARRLGFPLVVKPRSGFYARHVTLNIQNEVELKQAIKYATAFSPSFVVEKFIAKASIFRATVVDFDHVAVVQEIPAHVVGDGCSSIQELVEQKNQDPQRGQPDQKQYTLFKIVINETSHELLEQKGCTLDSIPSKNEVVYLQRNPFLKIGGDLVDVTGQTHPENIELFKKTAKLFDIRLTGIDFLAQDISKPWQEQTCAFAEINRDPSFEMHQVVTRGEPRNVARPVVDLIYKYYL